jgi:hypothetical protein
MIEKFDSSKYVNLFDITNLEPVIFLENFKTNWNLLDTYFNDIYITTLLKVQIRPSNLNMAAITNFTQLISEFSNNFIPNLQPLITNYAAFEIPISKIKYINNDFEMLGSHLLINSKVSNTISLTFNVQYKSYFFNFIDLSTIILDVTIPDLTPPIILFSNNNYSFNQDDLNDNSINSIITNLVKDVSYIDINQNHNISLSNTSYSYIIDKTTTVRSSTVNMSLLSIDLTKININSETDNSIFVDIYYLIKDNANNSNTIIRKLLLNRSNDAPLFYYFNINNTTYNKVSSLELVQLNKDITINTLKSELTKYITLIDPRKVPLTTLDTSVPKAYFEFVYNLGQIFIETIKIYDLSYNSNSKSLATYNVLTNTFINFNKTTNINGIILDNTSAILLDIGSYYVEYTSVRSIITNRFSVVRRVLTIVEPNIEPLPVSTHCCYPKVEYKPGLPDNYTFGSQNSTVMKRVKYIINRNR